MNPKKPKKFNKIKAIKKASRNTQEPHGRGGFHETEKDKPRDKKSVKEYLEEKDEIEADCCFYCGCGPAGKFELDEYGKPICEGCLEDLEKMYEDWDEDWGWFDNEDKWRVE